MGIEGIPMDTGKSERRDCDKCKGSGKVNGEKCNKCNGSGKIK